MTQEIDQSNFDVWISHPVTKELYTFLEILNEDLCEAMLNPAMVLAKDGQIQYARALGNQELITRILDLRLEDFITKEKETDEQEKDSPLRG